MNFDISQMLDAWEYQPGQVMVRRFISATGVEKIQLRVDLGILQMNAKGRPDGKRPHGFTSFYDYQRSRLKKHTTEHGNAVHFTLGAEDCAKLQVEALQYHHRYICLLQLEDFDGVVEDAGRNLQVFQFVNEHAENEEMAWALNQFRPQLLMIRTRATASRVLKHKDFAAAIELVGEGMRELREFYAACPQPELAEMSPEIQSLESWVESLRAQRPLSQRERLEQALAEALRTENYEKAAQVRDALKRLPANDI